MESDEVTEKQAIGNIKLQTEFLNSYGNNFVEFTESLRVAMQALEKQIPKKITKYRSCPNCGGDVWHEDEDYMVKYNHCKDCGQRLDWNNI
jgi:DNA-directed RNA polymerase subunit RPC12/RpoP